MTEYGLLLLLIAIGALVVLEALGVEIVEVWEATKNILPSV